MPGRGLGRHDRLRPHRQRDKPSDEDRHVNPPRQPDRGAERRPSTGAPVIAFARGLVKTYGTRETAVRALAGIDVDFARVS